jgi:hypothetical protein
MERAIWLIEELVFFSLQKASEKSLLHSPAIDFVWSDQVTEFLCRYLKITKN